MKHQHIGLVYDEETETWSVAYKVELKKDATAEGKKLKKDGTPFINIFTGDFLTV